MEFARFKKKLGILISSLGRASAFPKKIMLSAGILTIASTPSMNQPPLPADPKVSIKASDLSGFAHSITSALPQS